MYCKNKNPVSIYAIKNTINGKIYIGSTIDLKRRIYEHQYEVKQVLCGVYRNLSDGIMALSEDVKQFGWESFEWYVIETDVPFDSRREREAFWIEEYQTTLPSKGYNTRSEKPPSAVSVNLIYGKP